VRARLAAVLQMPVSQVRVIQATTGGGFGGKMIEDANSLLAARWRWRTGAPVRLVNNRLEDFLACATSVPERITLKLGMDRDGRIVAKDVRILADCGAYSGLSAEVMHVSAPCAATTCTASRNVRSHARWPTPTRRRTAPSAASAARRCSSR
jgi:CO/xanthine dehydrogenase Mo-binding subunit